MQAHPRVEYSIRRSCDQGLRGLLLKTAGLVDVLAGALKPLAALIRSAIHVSGQVP
jgi:hypothetical protein